MLFAKKNKPASVKTRGAVGLHRTPPREYGLGKAYSGFIF